MIMLGSDLANDEDLQKHVGDEVVIERTKFKVVGIYESSNMVDSNAAIIPLADLQDLMERTAARLISFSFRCKKTP